MRRPRVAHCQARVLFYLGTKIKSNFPLRRTDEISGKENGRYSAGIWFHVRVRQSVYTNFERKLDEGFLKTAISIVDALFNMNFNIRMQVGRGLKT